MGGEAQRNLATGDLHNPRRIEEKGGWVVGHRGKGISHSKGLCSNNLIAESARADSPETGSRKEDQNAQQESTHETPLV